MTFKIVEIQSTPNPNAAKFLLDREVAAAPSSFFNAESAKGYDLAERLFAVPGVTSLLFLGDFITVNKAPDAKWDTVTRAVRRILEAKP
jgi:hypothetical protein